MRNPIRITCALSVAILLATGAGGCLEEDSGTPSYASAESKSELAGFIREIGDELNECWGEEWGEGWKPAKIRVPKRAADTACGTIDADETGPAYCGDDRTMVLPARFFRDEIIGADNNGRNLDKCWHALLVKEQMIQTPTITAAVFARHSYLFLNQNPSLLAVI